MASADRTVDTQAVSITVPRWWKVPVAFVAGAALSAVSLLQFVPGSLISNLSGGQVFGLGKTPGEEEDLFLGDEGEYYIDEEGQLRRREVAETVGGASGSEGAAGTAGGVSGGGSKRFGPGPGNGGTGPGPGGPLECRAGYNGGATDTGVSGSTINLATTAVLDGPASSLLRDSVTGMQAVMNKVNKSGGICGRHIQLKVDNDGFDAGKGSGYIRSYIDSRSPEYFALPVVPSAEGLSAAMSFIEDAGMPVVGTDGMRIEQYQSAWVWPVAAATVSTMRIMAKHGHDTQQARTFAIVWDNKYRFGLEGKDAFINQVQQMGGTLVYDQPLNPDQPSYASEAEAFNQRCSAAKCDMVALLLLPDTAQKWMARNPAMGRLYTSGAQTLFTDRFGQQCVQAAGGRCHGIAVWTGYNPPIGALATRQGVAQYVNDVRELQPSIDVRNQFLQGAYLGMSVFVEALKRTGPILTREALRAELDKMDYQTDLTSTLSWRSGNHWANVRAQSFSMVVTQGTFNGWTHTSDFVRDPTK